MSGPLPPADFLTAITLTQLVSVDLLIYRSRSERKDSELLVGRRKNAPARGTLFVPGCRIWKSETPQDAIIRCIRTELGVDPRNFTIPEFFRVRIHRYPDNFAGAKDNNGVDIPTVYFSLSYKLYCLPVENRFVVDSQHDALFWMPCADVLSSPDVHQYTKDFLL